jgi:hypothetical protein
MPMTISPLVSAVTATTCPDIQAREEEKKVDTYGCVESWSLVVFLPQLAVLSSLSIGWMLME